MSRHFLNWLILIIFVFTKEINARPISYQGGWTVMQMNDFNRHSLHMHYSPSINFSLGYRGEYWRKKEWSFHGLQFNYLIKRLNNRNSQANFYLKSSAGFAYSNYKKIENKIEPNIFSGIAFDWENRRYFVSYENRINYNLTIEKFISQKARIGLAPYIGNYGDFHTWIMFKFENMSRAKNKIIYTPMLRVFKGDYLAEAGLTNYKDIMFNLIKRF
tara:strand:- start:330 stop:977 length:648 start_codon:yes stop_codon:yes gene_type:complete